MAVTWPQTKPAEQGPSWREGTELVGGGEPGGRVGVVGGVVGGVILTVIGSDLGALGLTLGTKPRL